jgi:hypothetical protein
MPTTFLFGQQLKKALKAGHAATSDTVEKQARKERNQYKNYKYCKYDCKRKILHENSLRQHCTMFMQYSKLSRSNMMLQSRKWGK